MPGLFSAAIVIVIGVGAVALTIYTAAHRKFKGSYLCEDCRFNNPSDCLKPERPEAMVCTSYRSNEASTPKA